MGSLVFRDADIEYFLLGYPGVGAGAGVPLSGLSVTIFLELQISIK